MGSAVTPKLVWCTLQAERKAWKEPDLAGTAQKAFLIHTQWRGRICCVRRWRTLFGLQFVKKKKKKKPNFIKTELFSFQIVNLSINVTHVVV